MSTPVDTPATARWVGRRYLCSIGGYRVPSYLAMLYVGCVVGITAAAVAASAKGMDSTRFALAAIVLLIPALIGARLWFVIQHLQAFRTEPQRLWRWQEGGAALDGGLVLSVASSIPLLAIAGLPFWTFWDAATFAMLIGVIIARFGCLMRGCCAGRATDSPFGVRLPNHLGQWQRRFPTPLLEAGWAALVLVGVLFTCTRVPFDGALFASAVAGYAIGRPLIALTRESENFRRDVSINLMVSTLLFAAATSVLIHRWPG